MIYAVFYIPYFFIKRKFHSLMIQRFGFIPNDILKKIRGKEVVWLHAVSVGEVMLLKPLVSRIRSLYPDAFILISTITKTGFDVAKNIVPDNAGGVIFAPLDLSFITKKVIKIFKPKIFFVVETEIWPNLFISLRKFNIPTFLINGRISDSSFKRYMLVRSIVKFVIKKIDTFFVQTETDADRFAKLGASREKIKVCSSLKFDYVDANNLKPQAASIENIFNMILNKNEKQILFVAGSTHDPEEKIILKMAKKIIGEYSSVIFVIAPRHVDRIEKIKQSAEKLNLKYMVFSDIKDSKSVDAARVIFIDKMGILHQIYKFADIVFVGGSLAKKGGHNIIEPARFKKPILFGPFMYNFSSISSIFLKKDSAMLVKNEKDLRRLTERLINSDEQRRLFGQKAYNVVIENEGATERILNDTKIFLNNNN